MFDRLKRLFRIKSRQPHKTFTAAEQKQAKDFIISRLGSMDAFHDLVAQTIRDTAWTDVVIADTDGKKYTASVGDTLTPYGALLYLTVEGRPLDIDISTPEGREFRRMFYQLAARLYEKGDLYTEYPLSQKGFAQLLRADLKVNYEITEIKTIKGIRPEVYGYIRDKDTGRMVYFTVPEPWIGEKQQIMFRSVVMDERGREDKSGHNHWSDIDTFGRDLTAFFKSSDKHFYAGLD